MVMNRYSGYMARQEVVLAKPIEHYVDMIKASKIGEIVHGSYSPTKSSVLCMEYGLDESFSIYSGGLGC